MCGGLTSLTSPVVLQEFPILHYLSSCPAILHYLTSRPTSPQQPPCKLYSGNYLYLEEIRNLFYSGELTVTSYARGEISLRGKLKLDTVTSHTDNNLFPAVLS